jgi:hypothetical protein
MAVQNPFTRVSTGSRQLPNTITNRPGYAGSGSAGNGGLWDAYNSYVARRMAPYQRTPYPQIPANAGTRIPGSSLVYGSMPRYGSPTITGNPTIRGNMRTGFAEGGAVTAKPWETGSSAPSTGAPDWSQKVPTSMTAQTGGGGSYERAGGNWAATVPNYPAYNPQPDPWDALTANYQAWGMGHGPAIPGDAAYVRSITQPAGAAPANTATSSSTSTATQQQPASQTFVDDPLHMPFAPPTSQTGTTPAWGTGTPSEGTIAKIGDPGVDPNDPHWRGAGAGNNVIYYNDYQNAPQWMARGGPVKRTGYQEGGPVEPDRMQAGGPVQDQRRRRKTGYAKGGPVAKPTREEDTVYQGTGGSDSPYADDTVYGGTGGPDSPYEDDTIKAGTSTYSLGSPQLLSALLAAEDARGNNPYADDDTQSYQEGGPVEDDEEEPVPLPRPRPAEAPAAEEIEPAAREPEIIAPPKPKSALEEVLDYTRRKMGLDQPGFQERRMAANAPRPAPEPEEPLSGPLAPQGGQFGPDEGIVPRQPLTGYNAAPAPAGPPSERAAARTMAPALMEAENPPVATTPRTDNFAEKRTVPPLRSVAEPPAEPLTAESGIVPLASATASKAFRESRGPNWEAPGEGDEALTGYAQQGLRTAGQATGQAVSDAYGGFKQRLADYVNGGGAMPPEQVQQVLKEAAAQNPTGDHNGDVKSVFDSFLAARSLENASRFLQAMKVPHDRAHMIATAALQAGSLENAAKFAEQAHALIPDGRLLRILPNKDGTVTLVVQRTDVPDAQAQSYTLTANQFYRYLTGPAGNFDTTAQNTLEENLRILATKDRDEASVTGTDAGATPTLTAAPVASTGYNAPISGPDDLPLSRSRPAWAESPDVIRQFATEFNGQPVPDQIRTPAATTPAPVPLPPPRPAGAPAAPAARTTPARTGYTGQDDIPGLNPTKYAPGVIPPADQRSPNERFAMRQPPVTPATRPATRQPQPATGAPDERADQDMKMQAVARAIKEANAQFRPGTPEHNDAVQKLSLYYIDQARKAAGRGAENPADRPYTVEQQPASRPATPNGGMGGGRPAPSGYAVVTDGRGRSYLVQSNEPGSLTLQQAQRQLQQRQGGQATQGQPQTGGQGQPQTGGQREPALNQAARELQSQGITPGTVKNYGALLSQRTGQIERSRQAEDARKSREGIVDKQEERRRFEAERKQERWEKAFKGKSEKDIRDAGDKYLLAQEKSELATILKKMGTQPPTPLTTTEQSVLDKLANYVNEYGLGQSTPAPVRPANPATPPTAAPKPPGDLPPNSIRHTQPDGRKGWVNPRNGQFYPDPK